MREKLTKKLDRLVDFLKTEDSFIITGHEQPDGDCVGSQFALAHLLEKMDTTVHLVNPDPPPAVFDFLTGKRNYSVEPPEKIVDAAIVLDCGNLSRTGQLLEYVEQVEKMVVLDHHRNNSITADLRLVAPDVSSVGELVYYLYQRAGETLSPDVALALYASIITDTGSFRHANTSARTHRVVADLIEQGDVKPYRVYSDIYERERKESVVLLGRVLAKLSQRDGVVWSEVPRQLFEETGTTEEDLKEVINYLRQVNESQVALLFSERSNGTVKVSFRAKNSLDLLPVVSKFGGGGHSGAAGASVEGELTEVREKVIEAVTEELEKNG